MLIIILEIRKQSLKKMLQGIVTFLIRPPQEDLDLLNWRSWLRATLSETAKEIALNTIVKLWSCRVFAVGFMTRVDKNTWNGSSKKSLETEIANKRYMLHNMHDLDARCKKAGVPILLTHE